MARQLRDQGEEIAILVSFDTPFRIDFAALQDPFPEFAELHAALVNPGTAPFPIDFGRFHGLLEEICRLMGIAVNSTTELLEYDPADRVRHLLEVADRVRPLQNYFSSTHRALTSYRPKGLPASLVWLSANEVRSTDFKARPTHHAWSDWFQGEVYEIGVPGDHVSMFSEPHVATLVALLNEQFQRLRGPSVPDAKMEVL
jgi:thioesterase domain-containing protein